MDNRSDETDRPGSGLDLTRRQALVGAGGLGAACVSGLAATSGDEPSANFDALRWRAQRRRKFAQPYQYVWEDEDGQRAEDNAFETPLHTVDEVSSLSYLGVRWDEFGNPDAGAEVEGAWQHTFLLTNLAMAQEMGYSGEYGDDPQLDHPVPYRPHRLYRTVPSLRVEAADSSGTTETDDPTDSVAISPIRDENRFGLLDPTAFESAFGTEPASGTTGKSFTQKVAKNDNQYQPDVGTLRYVQALNDEARQDEAALLSLGDTFLSLAKDAAQTLPVVRTLVTAGDVLWNGYQVYEGLKTLAEDADPPSSRSVNFFQGFEQSYPATDYLAGPHCGAFVTFHVYVAPDATAEVDVTSSYEYETARTSPGQDDGEYPEYDVPKFESSVRWRLELEGPAHPDEASHAPADLYSARIVDQEEQHSKTDDQKEFPGKRVDQSIIQKYPRPKQPTPSIVPDPSNPQIVSDGTELAFDAYDTTVVDGNVESYDWSVHYTSEPDSHADEYVEVIPEESYAVGSGPEFEFTVDVPDDPDYDDVHMVSLEVTTYNPEQGERRTATDDLLVSTTDLGEPEFSVVAPENAVEGGDLEFAVEVSDTPTYVDAVEWEVTEYGFERPSTAPNDTDTGREFTFTPPEPGQYTVEATVVDAVGPIDSASVDVTVEELNPTARIEPPIDGVKAGEPAQFSVEYDGVPNVDESQISWEFGGSETRTGWTASYTVPMDAETDRLDVSVEVPSSTHDVTATASNAFPVAHDPPMYVELDAPDSMIAGAGAEVTAQAYDYESDTVTYMFGEYVDKGRVAPHENTGRVEFDRSAVGTRTIEVTAREDGDNDEVATQTAEIDVLPFELSIEGPSEPKEQALVSYDAVVDGDVVDPTFDWNVLDGSGSTVSGRFDETGNRTVSLEVTDGDHTVRTQRDIDVQSDDDLNVFFVEFPGGMHVDETATVEVDVEDAEAEVRYSWNGADPPPGSHGTSDRATIDPTSTGMHEVSVEATEEADNLESDSVSRAVPVDEPPEPELTIHEPNTTRSCSGDYDVEATVSNVAFPVSYTFSLDGREIGSGEATSSPISTDFDVDGTGLFTIALEIEDDEGRAASTSPEFSLCGGT